MIKSFIFIILKDMKLNFVHIKDKRVRKVTLATSTEQRKTR